MTDMKCPEFTQAWTVITDIAKACREFNELQFKYRQLALSLILAAYAATGYFWVSADTTRAKQPAVPVASVTVSPGDASATTSSKQVPIGDEHNSSAVPYGITVEQLTLIFLGIGTLMAFSSLVIWHLDVRYHLLLESNFNTARSFEQRLNNDASRMGLPMLHKGMSRHVPESLFLWAMWLFYWLIALAALLPWFAYDFLHNDKPGGLFGNQAYNNGLLAGGIVTLIFLTLHVIIFWKRKDIPQKCIHKNIQFQSTDRARNTLPSNSLLDMAKAAHANAYGRYSGFCVGAAVLARRGNETDMFAGCNLENTSYGLTMCAERNAIAAAVAAGYQTVEEVLIFTNTDTPTPPCGACRQVIHEFGPQARVCLVTHSGIEKVYTLDGDLYPHPFNFSPSG